MKARRLALLLVVVLGSVLFASLGDAQQDQRALALQLLQGPGAERSRALEAVRALGANSTGPELRAALITLLERNNRAARRNEGLATVESPEFIAHVAHVVSQLEDPQAIPALAGALGTGSTLVRDALADFGEGAAPAVLAVVNSSETHYNAVDEGLITLRFLVEGTGPRPLSAGTLDQIRGAARQRLTGKQYFTTLWRAIDLAVALNDPSLRQTVQVLASDATEVSARGVTNPDLIAKTQERATQRLAGGPASPRYRSPTERSQLLAPR
jgi:hypothetical protein